MMVWVAEAAVSSIVGRSERAHDVVARSIASSRLTRHLDRHLTAVVCGRGVVHRHFVKHSTV